MEGPERKAQKERQVIMYSIPKQGFFLALLPIGNRETDEAEFVIPTCTEYTQNLFRQSVSGHHGKSPAFEVNDENIVEDMKNLIAIRISSTKTK